MNIYEQVTCRLRNMTQDSILDDRFLTLHFVKLERACRSKDLDLVQLAFSRMRSYLQLKRKEKLIAYGVSYIRFHGGGRSQLHIVSKDTGGSSFRIEYEHPTTHDQHALNEWAAYMDRRLRKLLFTRNT